MPLGSHYRARIKRNAQFPEPYIICVSQSPQYWNPSSRFLSWSVYTDGDVPIPKPSLTCLSGVPNKRALLQALLAEPLCLETGTQFPEFAFTYVSFRVPSKQALPAGSPKSCHRERRSVSRAFFYLSLKVPRKRVPHPPVSPSIVPYADMLISRNFFDGITTLWRFKSSLHY